MDIVNKISDLQHIIDFQWEETVLFANDVAKTIDILTNKVVALEAAQQAAKQAVKKPSKLRVVAVFGLGIYAGVKIMESTTPSKSTPTTKNEV